MDYHIKRMERQLNWSEIVINSRNTLQKCRELLRKKQDRYFSVSREFKYPMTLKDYDWPQYRGYRNVGIVLQGSVKENITFVLNSVYWYRKIYPDIAIVVSAWKDELKDADKTKLEEYRCRVLENEDPQVLDKEKGHLGHQLYSTLKGIEYLEELGIRYVLKMRNDIRCYKADIIPYFLNLLHLFPKACEDMEERLLSVSFSNSFIYVPFHLSDFIWFGHMEDMKKLYSIPYRGEKELRYLEEKDLEFKKEYDKSFLKSAKKEYVSDKKPEPILDEFYLKVNSEEVYIVNSYVIQNLKSIVSHKNESMAETYISFIKKCLIVADEEQVGAYWDKYNYSLFRQDMVNRKKGILTHSVWLDMLLNKQSTEKEDLDGNNCT